jgi:hypothetical protein
MIEFIQNYVTKALPPESFTDGQQVERSAESELYFVRLGVAGYLVDGKLLDQDYLPITRQTVVVVATTDRRFSDTGRGGEVIGLEAPQRATSGPGNEVLFAGQPDSTTLGGVEFEQLRGDLASSASQFEQYRTINESEVERLKGLIDAATDAFHKADTAFGEERTKLVGERDQALADLTDSRSQHEGLVLEYQAAQKQIDTGAARIIELEGLLAEANKPDSKPSRTPK